jgi:hypothetical protein
MAPSFTQRVRRSPSFHTHIPNSSSQQLPIRNRTAGVVRAKGDENATSKHLRQGSGAGVGPSRSTTFGKNARERPVLNEVTKTTINRKVVPVLLVPWHALIHRRSSHSRPPARRRSRWILSSAVPCHPQPPPQQSRLSEFHQLRDPSHHNPSNLSLPAPHRSVSPRASHRLLTSPPQLSKMRTNRAWTSRKSSAKISGSSPTPFERSRQ